MLSVLVIDDSLGSRTYHASILDDAGHAITAVETLAEGLAAIATSRPDVVVLEVGTPGKPEELFEALRSGPHVGLVFCSAPDLPELREHAAAHGAVFLAMPIRPEEVRAAVERVAARSLPCG